VAGKRGDSLNGAYFRNAKTNDKLFFPLHNEIFQTNDLRKSNYFSKADIRQNRQ
jgi:hypothetical protein